MNVMKGRRRPKNGITAEYLRSRLNYDPHTGIFTWRPRDVVSSKWDKFFNTRYAGKIAGSIRKDGYVEIRIDGISYLGHRLAWLHYHGEMPVDDIDHKDRVTTHNWIENLRPATVSQNMQNTSIRVDNTSGIKGVAFDRGAGKWRAYIGIGGKSKYIGIFGTKEEARAARVAVADSNFGEFSTQGDQQCSA